MQAGCDICIVAATRTPIGCFQGALASLSATELGAAAINGALNRCNITSDRIQEAFIGNVLNANLGQAPAKQACLKAGLPDGVPCTGINKVCASGMKAVIIGAQSIMSNFNRVVLVGGMESMSNVPHYLPATRQGHKFGDIPCIDGMIRDGLWDPYDERHMGSFAELCAKEYKITREEQDDYAIQSFERAISSAKCRLREITPVAVRDKKGNETIVEMDEGIGRLDKEKLRRLKPSFQNEHGTVTPGNSSQLSDGAAALILMQRSTANAERVPILGTVIGMVDAAQKPSSFTTTPALAVEKLLKSCRLDSDRIDLFEINEAFSVVALANQKLLHLDSAKMNVWGGAVAIGHPLGCSGARILVTLVHQLKALNKTYGIAAICNGGGGASAVLIRNEN